MTTTVRKLKQGTRFKLLYNWHYAADQKRWGGSWVMRRSRDEWTSPFVLDDHPGFANQRIGIRLVVQQDFTNHREGT